MPGMWLELERIFAQDGVTIGHFVSFWSLSHLLIPSEIKAFRISLVMQPDAPTILRPPIESLRSTSEYSSIHQK